MPFISPGYSVRIREGVEPAICSLHPNQAFLMTLIAIHKKGAYVGEIAPSCIAAVTNALGLHDCTKYRLSLPYNAVGFATSDSLAALRMLSLNDGWNCYWDFRQVLPLAA